MAVLLLRRNSLFSLLQGPPGKVYNINFSFVPPPGDRQIDSGGLLTVSRFYPFRYGTLANDKLDNNDTKSPSKLSVSTIRIFQRCE